MKQAEFEIIVAKHMREKIIRRKKKLVDRLRELHAWPFLKKLRRFNSYKTLIKICEKEICNCNNRYLEYMKTGNRIHITTAKNRAIKSADIKIVFQDEIEEEELA